MELVRDKEFESGSLGPKFKCLRITEPHCLLDQFNRGTRLTCLKEKQISCQNWGPCWGAPGHVWPAAPGVGLMWLYITCVYPATPLLSFSENSTLIVLEVTTLSHSQHTHDSASVSPPHHQPALRAKDGHVTHTWPINVWESICPKPANQDELWDFFL